MNNQRCLHAIIQRRDARQQLTSYPEAFSNDQSKSRGSKKDHQMTFLLLGKEQFAVAVPYAILTDPVKQVLRRNMADWNRDLKLWVGPFDNYQNCLREARALFDSQARVSVNKIPEFVFKAAEEMQLDLEVKNIKYAVVKTISYSAVQTKIDPSVLPFYNRLYAFQKESLDFGIRRHGRLLLADEMGVGKTLQSLAIMSVYRHQWPFVVICPSALRLNWQQEILNWLGDYISKSQIQVYNKGGRPINESAKAIIVSYDLAWKIREQLEHVKAVIADEAHYLKNSGNKRSDMLTPFLSTRRRVVLLTGTPALAKPREIFNLISIVRPDVFVDFKEFGYRYCQPTVNTWSNRIEYNGCEHSKELYFLLKDRVMIRRLKKEVLTQLPDKQRQKILVETDKNTVKEIKELLNNHGGLDGKLDGIVLDLLGNFNNPGDGAVLEDARTAITKAYSLTGIAKLASAKEYVLQLLENGVKLIVFAHHKAVLDGLEEVLKEKKFKFIRIDGTVSNQKRHQHVNSFQENQDIMVALLSITAAGVGLTLTAASTVVFTELHWTPGMMVQAEDRAHRIGQKSCVNCHYLIGENTLDDILYRFLQKKINNVSSFVDGKAEKLQMEKLSKGEKGKFAPALEPAQRVEKNILFKFESIKPMINKYFLQHSQESEISDSVGESRCDSDSQPESKSFKDSKAFKSKIKRQPYQIEQETPKQKESQQKVAQNESDCQSQAERKSSDMCEFIVTNAQQILQYSQRTESDLDSEQTR